MFIAIQDDQKWLQFRSPRTWATPYTERESTAKPSYLMVRYAFCTAFPVHPKLVIEPCPCCAAWRIQ